MDAQVLCAVCAGLSCAGSLVLVLVYALSQRLDRLGSQFVFSQAICDFFLASNIFVTIIWTKLGASDTYGLDGVSWGCQLSGFFGQFSSQATVAWNFAMSVGILQTVQSTTHYQMQTSSFVMYHSYVWASSLVNAAILLVVHKYGPYHTGCWIDSTSYLPFSAVPLTIYFIGSSTVLVLSVRRVRLVTARLSKSSRNEESTFMNQTIKYIIVFLVMWWMPLVAIYLEYLRIPVPHTFGVLAFASVSLQGFANSLVWMSSPRLLKSLHEKYVKQGQKYQRLVYSGTERTDGSVYGSTHWKRKSEGMPASPEDDVKAPLIVVTT